MKSKIFWCHLCNFRFGVWSKSSFGFSPSSWRPKERKNNLYNRQRSFSPSLTNLRCYSKPWMWNLHFVSFSFLSYPNDKWTEVRLTGCTLNNRRWWSNIKNLDWCNLLIKQLKTLVGRVKGFPGSDGGSDWDMTIIVGGATCAMGQQFHEKQMIVLRHLSSCVFILAKDFFLSLKISFAHCA